MITPSRFNPGPCLRRLAIAFVSMGVLSLPPYSRAQEAPPAARTGHKNDHKRDVRAPEARVLTPEERLKNVESFDMIWTTIRDKHFDRKLGGLDWNAVRDQLRPKVERASTMKEARAAMNEAIDRLGQTHFGIIPAELYDNLDDHKKGTGELGFDVRLIDGKAIVSAVSDASAAAMAGVKTGWVVDKIDGKPVSEILKTARAAYSKSGMVRAYETRAVLARLSGPVDSVIAVDFLDDKDVAVHKDLAAREPLGVPATFGNLPTFHVQFQSKRIDHSVMYVSLNIFFDLVNVLKQFGEVVESGADTDGLIIDLRGNPGGIGAMSMAFGGWLVSERGLKLGTLITRDASVNFSLQPRRRSYKAPVAVLVDELSMSTSEILAGGLRDLKRARVFGAKTPGAALPSTIERLPNGDRFQYAFANYISIGGKPLEGVGVVPDVLAPLTRDALVAGRDPAVESAVQWIRSLKAKS